MWRFAQVSWPATLDLEVGESKNYVVAVDATGNPPPATEVIPGTAGTSTTVRVQCVLAARLVSTDSDVDVRSDRPGTDWVVQSFDVTDQLYWSWAVKAKRAGSHELSLQFRPVLVTVGKGVQPAGGAATTFERITEVNVTNSASDHGGQTAAPTSPSSVQPTVRHTAAPGPSTAPAAVPPSNSSVAFTADPVAWTGNWVSAHQGYLEVIGAFLVAVIVGTLSAIGVIKKKYREVFKRGRRSPAAKSTSARAASEEAMDNRADARAEPKAKKGPSKPKATANTAKQPGVKKQAAPNSRGGPGPGIDLSVHDEKQDQGK